MSVSAISPWPPRSRPVRCITTSAASSGYTTWSAPTSSAAFSTGFRVPWPRGTDEPGEAAHAALLVAFDFLIDQSFARLLADAHPDRSDDPIESYIATIADQQGVPIGSILVAAWRAALRAAIDGVPADRARAALVALHVEEPDAVR